MKKIVFVLLLALILVPSLIWAQQSGTGQSTSACLSFDANLTVGSRDATTSGKVSVLQNYLISKGFLSMPAGVSTGYFGKLTRAAMSSFQVSAGISPSVGYFGKITRARISSMTCAGVSNNVSISSISPTSGPVGAAVTIHGSGFTGGGNSVKFNSYSLGSQASSDGQNISFTIPAWAGLYCASGMACPAIAAQITPGVYSLSVINTNGTSNLVNFTVTSTSTASSTSPDVPIINSASGPLTLSVNQTGTWTVSASDLQNKQLSYAVDWGDSACSSGSGCTTSGSNPSSNASFQQTTSFTHSYSQNGIYNQTFTVKNTDNQQVTASTSVQVGNTSINSTPHLNSLSPTAGAVGAKVTIAGTNFTSAGNVIKFGDSADITTNSSDSRTLTFTVPGNYSSCSSEGCTNVYRPVGGGSYQVTVTNSKGSSNSIMFTVTSS